MKVDLKDYGIIGFPRLLNVKVLKISLEDLQNNNYQNTSELFCGKSEDMQPDISNLHYYKISLGNPTIYYVVEE